MIDLRLSIYWKLLLTLIASLFVACLMVFSMLFVIGTQIEAHPQIKKGLIRETHKIADQIALRLQNSSAPLKDIIKEVHEKENVNIRVFDVQGNELVAFMEDKLKRTKKISLPIIEETFRNGENFQFTDPWWRNIYVASVPLTKAGEDIGILQSYYPSSTGGDRLPPYAELYITILIIAGFTAFLSRLFTRPIRELTQVAREMSKGNLGVKVKVRSRDEIGQLGKTFNEMSQRLADLRKSRKELL